MGSHLIGDKSASNGTVPSGRRPGALMRCIGRIAVQGCIASIGVASGVPGASAAALAHESAVSGEPASPADPVSSREIGRGSQIRLAQAREASLVVQQISGDATAPIPVKISLVGQQDGEYKFLMIKGLPKGFRMSAGFGTKDAWLVSVSDFEGLQLIAPQNFVGDLNLQFLLYRARNGIPEEQTVTAHILPPGVRGASSSPNAYAPRDTAAFEPNARFEQPAPPAVSKPRVSVEEENEAMQRAAQLLDEADIAAARLVYEAMAMKGSARAAFAMAQSFDPAFLQKYTAGGGLKPDINQALKWYKKATEMGSAEAQARLAVLSRSQ